MYLCKLQKCVVSAKANLQPNRAMSKSPVFIWRAIWSALTPSAPATTPSFAQALETSMVCEIPFETLDDLSGKMPNLRQQMMRLMSGEIKGDQPIGWNPHIRWDTNRRIRKHVQVLRSLIDRYIQTVVMIQIIRKFRSRFGNDKCLCFITGT